MIVSQDSMKLPIWIIIGFQQRDRQDSQNLNKHSSCRSPVTSAQGANAMDKYPDAGILLNYDADYYSQDYSQFKEDFRALTKHDILQPYIRDTDFRSSNIRVDDVGYN